jgi:hypothetical protein
MTTPSPDMTARTVVLERYRAIAMGMYESAPSTFLLLILVRWFHGNAADKSLIAAASNAGLLLAPATIFLARKLRWSAPAGVAALTLVASLALGLAALIPGKQAFVSLAFLGALIPSAATPLLTTLYQSNYPIATRGRIFAQNNGIRIATSIAFSSLAGWFISDRIHLYPFLLLLFSLALAGSALAAARIPTAQEHPTATPPLLSCFQYVKSDPIFRGTLISWMLLGLGYLMMVPIRVEYLANTDYGLNLSEFEIALFIATIPNIARLVGSTIWGRIFDVANFFSLRIILNFSFLIGTLAFFASDSWIGLGFSALVLGFTTSGGDVAWSLWVTKFAPAERVPDYMAVHVFFTGVRGVIAPALAFLLLQHISPLQLSWISAGLMSLSIVQLLPVWRGSIIPKSAENSIG